MPRLLLVLAVLALAAPLPAADPTPWAEDVRFAESMRARDQNDLALEFLQRMEKGAPPELLKELPLEFAKTRLRLAATEPESGKRLAIYREARENFEKFVAVNPGHPRVAEANLDVARVLNLQGKTEYSKALLNPDRDGKREEAARARATLERAAARLTTALAELEATRARMPDPSTVTDRPARAKVQAEVNRAELEIAQTKLDLALNLYDRSETYLDAGGLTASQLLDASTGILEKLLANDVRTPIPYKAQAWLGRIYLRTATAEKARNTLRQVLAGVGPSAGEGQRLARYFLMLATAEQPDEKEKRNVDGALIAAGEAWFRLYPAYRKTPEGYGVAYLLAGAYLRRATGGKVDLPEQTRALATARALLRDVENNENEFTDRARGMKIAAMDKQGAFKKKIETLANFEDCYVRAQYEQSLLAEKPEEKKERVAAIMAALRRALALTEGKGLPPTLERNTARATLAFWAWNTGHPEEAVAVGEAFARDDPRSSQAAAAGIYALEAYLQLVKKKQDAMDDDAPQVRGAMLRLAQYLVATWPRERPGDLARHLIGRQLIKEDNLPEAISVLSAISPDYPSYTHSQVELAEAALRADREDREADPVAGDRKGDYRKRALWALEHLPEPTPSGDPGTNQLYFTGKAVLGRELAKAKRYADMEATSADLLKRMAGLKLSADAEKDKAVRAQLVFELIDVSLFARFKLAEAAFTAGDNARAAGVLDPLVDTLVKQGEVPEKINLQKNQQLATAILSLALRANLLLSRIDRTEQVLDALDKVGGGAGEGSSILTLLAGLIRRQVDETRKRGDKDALEKAVKGYTAILDKRIEKQKTNRTPEFSLVVGECYSSLGRHDKAAEELAKVQAPKAAAPGSPEERTYRAAQLLLARELRLEKSEASLGKAAEILAAIRGPDGAPRKNWGWGRTNLDALKEYGLLLEARNAYRKAFEEVWKPLAANLVKRAASDNRLREQYLECYYHLIYCLYQDSKGQTDEGLRDKGFDRAAGQIVELEKAYEGFGNEASQKRFADLLAAEAPLRERVEKLKNPGK